MANKWTYSATKAGYQKMWDSIVIKGGADSANAERFAQIILQGTDKYQAVEAATGVPWYFVGALHMRESSCDFRGVLHNGEQIIGTGRVTSLVPAGCGPFESWVEAAIDAINIKNLGRYRGQWCPSLMGYVSEIYNGLGYKNNGVNSPYVWAGSNHEQTGMYVADHQFDRSKADPRIGTMTVIKRLCEIRPSIAARMRAESNAKEIAVAAGVAGAAGAGAATVSPSPTEVAVDVGTSSVDLLAQLAPVMNLVWAYGPMVLGALAFAIVSGVVWYQFYKRRLD